ncbi:MAG: hypothetical protein CM15mP22_0920 [Gammaproteobacteria bacterium]|nr:MAG: hypothetical protein CM15mP22_0920 [Gammaproteobacteria bacterium]
MNLSLLDMVLMNFWNTFSNDMWPFHPEFPNAFPDDLMLYRNEKPIEVLVDQSDLTKE